MPENGHIKQLLAEIALHDSQVAYKQLFLLLHKPLCRFAWSILKSNDDAQEVVSDVFIGIWEKRHRLTSIESPLLYFYTSVKNHSLNRIAREKRQQTVAPEEWFVQLNSVYFDPEKLMMTDEIIRQVKQAIYDLPPRCRLVFKLVKEDGLKYREVAELLQLSAKTVEAQMAIALRRIGKCMHLDITIYHPKSSIKK